MKTSTDNRNCSTFHKTIKTLVVTMLFGFSVVVSVNAIAESSPIENEVQLSMLSAQGRTATISNYEREYYTEEDYVNELVNIVFGEDSGPDYSNEDVYLDHLVKAINNETNLGSPDFSQEDVYVKHLVEIML